MLPALVECTRLHRKAELTHAVVPIRSAERTPFDRKHTNQVISNICWMEPANWLQLLVSHID